jgi:hypothetical protein
MHICERVVGFEAPRGTRTRTSFVFYPNPDTQHALLAQMSKVCGKCAKDTAGGQTYTVENSTYHRACFVCALCGGKLAGTTFMRVGEQPHSYSCQSCFKVRDFNGDCRVFFKILTTASSVQR